MIVLVLGSTNHNELKEAGCSSQSQFTVGKNRIALDYVQIH